MAFRLVVEYIPSSGSVSNIVDVQDCKYATFNGGLLDYYSENSGSGSEYLGDGYYMYDDSELSYMEWPEGWSSEVCIYKYDSKEDVPSNPTNPDDGDNPDTEVDDTPMVVTFNYYIDGTLIDDTTLEQIVTGMSEPVEEIWPRTLECYHIRFDKINPTGDSTLGTSYNSIEFTYIDEHKFDEKDFVDNWPSTGTLNNTKLLYAFPHRYFEAAITENNCITINGIGYKEGESFTEKPTFHSNNTKTLEVNLYYISDRVSIKVHSYNVDPKYSDSDLWGYVSAQMNSVPSDGFTTTYVEYEYAVPLTAGYSMYCRAIAKPGFEFYKWVSTSEVNEKHNEYSDETDRRNAVLALPAIESSDDSLLDNEINISAYSSKDITAVFKSLKNEVKLYKGLDFSDSDTYYILGGDKQWKNNSNSNVDITIPNREGATLLGWVDYNQEEYDPDTKEYPYITRSEYNAILLEHDFDNLYEDIFNFICDSRERIISGVIRIDVKDGTKVPILISNNEGYTDSQGNWLTGDKTLYPLWLLEEYDIKYVSAGEDSLVVDETGTTDGKLCVLNPSDYYLPTTYTIVDDFSFMPLVEIPDLDVDFPQYCSFDRWVPSEIKPFTKTGPQTITAYWIEDIYKITLEKNNNYLNQSVRIKVGESKFVNEEKINNPSTRTAYKSFEGWYTENDINTENGTGDLIIDKEGKLQPNVSGYTDSVGGWIKNENTTVYAKWTPEEYTIRYYIYYNEEYEVIIHNYTIEDTKPTGYNLLSDPFGDFTPEGHFLDGWYTNEDYSGSQISILERGTTGDKTFYGMFKPQEYTIAYNNIDYCTNIEELPVKHTYGSETILIDPEVPQYEFLGWYTDEQFTNKITSIPADYTNPSDYTGFGYIYLYAKLVLEQIKYTVKHYKQALDGTYPDNLCVTEEYYGTIGDSVTPDVKDYIGFTKPSKQTVIISTDGSTVVVYNYERNKYNITWEVNGGEALTGDYTNGSVYFETPIIKPNNPIKEGYVFSGWSPSIPETMPANDIVFTASYIEEKTNLVSEIIDTELETVTDGKIATDKWINNAIGEPEKTIFEHLGNFFNTTFGNNITGECVTGNDLENFFSTELNKCIKQSQFIEIFSNSENVSNGYIVEKNFTFSISSNNESNLEFTVTIPESEESIPNYPNTTGFIMYYTLGSNPTLYKTYVPINKSCHFSLENTSDSIVIHRIPLYYLDSMNACILPKITIQNNTNRIVGDTLITSQIIE